jgi:hypothetical protein
MYCVWVPIMGYFGIDTHIHFMCHGNRWRYITTDHMDFTNTSKVFTIGHLG